MTFYYFAVLRIDYAKTVLLDLQPYTDATEYFAQAKALAVEGRPQIQIGHDKLPSRYPYGYPVLMLPWLKILPEGEGVLAPFRTNQTVGLVMLIGAFYTYCYLLNPLSGGIAALLLATVPAFFTFCRSSMADLGTSALVAVAFIFVYLGLKERRRWKIYLAVLFLGLSLNFRLQSLFFAPLLLAMALFPANTSRLRWLGHCTAALCVFIVGAAPILTLNSMQFGSPLDTGYNFWLLGSLKNYAYFSVANIPRHAAMLWEQFALKPRNSNSANIFGTGTFFVPAFVLLIMAGFAFIAVNRFVICAFVAAMTYLLCTLTYQYVSGRFYLPLFVLSVPIAVLPVNWAATSLITKTERFAAVCILTLFAAACLGYPSHSGSGSRLKRGRSQAWDAMHFTSPPRRSARFIAMNHFVENFRHQPGIVLSDINPVYLNALLPKPFVAAPLDEKHSYGSSRLWRYGRPEAIALVTKGLGESQPIYALFTSRREMDSKLSRLPIVAGYTWEVAPGSVVNSMVLTLVATASQ